MWQNDKTPEAPGRLENLKELVKALEQFDNLQGFLEHVSLIMDNETEEAAEKVSIMTLHAAKGLEFPVVFLPGWEDGLFPSQRSMDESGLKGLEEERRLAYVGITRAEELCTISFAANRRVYGQWQSAAALALHRRTARGACRGADRRPAFTAAALARRRHGRSTHGGNRRPRPMSTTRPAGSGCRTARANRPVAQPREARGMVIDATAVSSFALGDRVFHQKFGYGDGRGDRGRQAGHRLRQGRDQEDRRALRGRSAEAADDVPF